MALIETLWQVLITILGLLIAAIPLYLTIGLLGGRRSIFIVVAVNLLTGFLFLALRDSYPFWGLIIGFLLSVWIYREIFRLKWWKALLAFFLQFVILVIFWLVIGALLATAGIATGLIIGSLA